MICGIAVSISVLYKYFDSRGGGYFYLVGRRNRHMVVINSRYSGNIQLYKLNLFYFVEVHGCVVY